MRRGAGARIAVAGNYRCQGEQDARGQEGRRWGRPSQFVLPVQGAALVSGLGIYLQDDNHYHTSRIPCSAGCARPRRRRHTPSPRSPSTPSCDSFIWTTALTSPSTSSTPSSPPSPSACPRTSRGRHHSLWVCRLNPRRLWIKFYATARGLSSTRPLVDQVLRDLPQAEGALGAVQEARPRRGGAMAGRVEGGRSRPAGGD